MEMPRIGTRSTNKDVRPAHKYGLDKKVRAEQQKARDDKKAAKENLKAQAKAARNDKKNLEDLAAFEDKQREPRLSRALGTVGYRMNDWHNKFAAQALKGIRSFQVERNPMLTPLLLPRIHPICPGLQSHLIRYTFAYYLSCLAAIPGASPRSQAPAIGALLLSMQAVERALNLWKTGVYVNTHGHSTHFSVESWGDCVGPADQLTGERKLGRRATKYVTTVQKWKKEHQWDDGIRVR
ncbi:hypothetical protein FB451DRAFT_1392871 [Mycena latifolia]|nr:hypothetical protein FB451DRAFT_1392871 [Mycena latifolia]